MPSVRARGMSRTRPLMGQRRRRVVVLVAEVEGSFLVGIGSGRRSCRLNSDAVRSDCGWSSCMLGSGLTPRTDFALVC